MLNRTTRVLKALGREPRKNRRLRDVIEELTEEVGQLRQDVNLQSYRIAQIQARIDLVKKKKTKK